MAKASAYFSQSVGQLNNPYATIQQLVNQLGGLNNPVADTYTPAEKINVVDPRIRTIAEYLQQVGAENYQYNYDDILNLLNAATEASEVSTQAKLQQADDAYKRAVAETQDSAIDTIRQQYAQGIQNGINKGMAAANQLSAILATSKENAKTTQSNAESRINAANEYYADMAKNGVTALDKSNAAMETLMGNIRQLYNDEVQQRTSELEYNASIEETLANYLANKYSQDVLYANNVNTQAANIYNTNQSSLAQLINAAIGAEAQDNYSGAYRDAAQIQADAQVRAADIAAQAQLEAQRLSMAAAQAAAQAQAARNAATQPVYRSSSGGSKNNSQPTATVKNTGSSGTTRKVNPGTPYTPPYTTNSPGTTYRAYVKPFVEAGGYRPTAYAGVTAAVNQMLSDANKNTRAQSRR